MFCNSAINMIVTGEKKWLSFNQRVIIINIEIEITASKNTKLNYFQTYGPFYASIL
jgi:hypothetical protein